MIFDEATVYRQECDALQAKLKACETQRDANFQVMRDLNEEIATLEQQLTAMTEQWQKTNAQYESTAKAVTRLTTQLAAMTAERDEARNAMTMTQFDHDHYERVKQQITETTAHLEAQRVEISHAVEREHRAKLEAVEKECFIARTTLTEVKQQLATVTQERDEAFRILKAMAVTEEDIHWSKNKLNERETQP